MGSFLGRLLPGSFFDAVSNLVGSKEGLAKIVYLRKGVSSAKQMAPERYDRFDW